MSDIEKFIEELLNSRTIREGAAFSSRSYSDTPIIQSGCQFKRQKKHEEKPRQEAMPSQYKQLRRLEQGGAAKFMLFGSRSSNKLFYQQAQLAADFEDDYPLLEDVHYFMPTYSMLKDAELRSYFSWRTKLRHNKLEPAPITFAYIYCYELLCGVGTTAGKQAYCELEAFATAYEELDPDSGALLKLHLRAWLADYAVYHGLHDLLKDAKRQEEHPLHQAVFTLLLAEGDALARTGRERRIVIPGTEAKAIPADALFEAICICSRYHLEKSRLTKSHREDMLAVVEAVFAKMVEHCSKRRNADFVEGMFGYGNSHPYYLFDRAVFYDSEPHKDVHVRLSDTCSLVCKDNQWRKNLVCDSYARSKQLGQIMHALDCELRRQLNYPYPLKEKKIPKYLAKMIRESVAEWLRRKKEAEARQISVDLSKLAAIRAAASVTQEALLVDEEREELDARPTLANEKREELAVSSAGGSGAEQLLPNAKLAAALSPIPSAEKPAEPAASAPLAAAGLDSPEAAAAKPAASTSSVEGLNELESRVLFALFHEDSLNGILTAKDPLPSIIVDRINEQLYDLIGDSVIEFDGETPHLIEDYREDLQELMFS